RSQLTQFISRKPGVTAVSYAESRRYFNWSPILLDLSPVPAIAGAQLASDHYPAKIIRPSDVVRCSWQAHCCPEIATPGCGLATAAKQITALRLLIERRAGARKGECHGKSGQTRSRIHPQADQDCRSACRGRRSSVSG